MDRDKRWSRIKRAYDLLVNGIGKNSISALNSIRESYNKGITDEFIEPIVIMNGDKPMAQIKDGDLVIFFNFRTDRGRQLTEVLTQYDLDDGIEELIKVYKIIKTNFFSNV